MESMETNVKKYITSLLTSTPLVVTVQQLCKDYRNTIGESIPYQKLGYNSLEHFLRSIPDTVQVKGGGYTAQVIPVVSERSAHVNQLVTKQKVVRNKKGYSVPQKRTSVIFPPQYKHYANKVENATQQTTSNKMYYPNKDVSSQPKYPPQTVPTYDNSKLQSDYSNNYVPSAIIKNETSTYVTRNNNETLTKQSNILGTVKDTNKFEEKIISEAKPVTNFASGTTYTKWMKTPKKIVNDLDRTPVEQQENSVPAHIRNNLRTLIRQCPEGIWCAEIPDKYRKMFKRELDYQELGFKSLIHLCVCLSSIFHYARPSTEDYRLYDRSRPLPECAEKTYTMSSYGSNNKNNSDMNSALPNIDLADVKKFLPADIFMSGEEIPRAFVSRDVKEDDNIDVVVGEIYDLSKFWVYLANSQLDGLMDDLQDFYREHAQDYIIPDYLIREGIYCVQIIFGEYHRAFIVDTMPELEDTIRVIFIDYGTMTKVSTKGLCFLHNKFSQLEAQAIRCRLANVFPLEEGAPWTREACKAFRRLVVDRDISAKISHINWEEQYLEVYLADVMDEANIFYINDRLVEEGYAQQPNKERKQPFVDSIYTPIVKYLHLFPTFLELEHGLAPSTAEMEVFHDCNIPINFLYPQYFYIDHSGEEAIIKAAEEFHEKHCIREKRRTPSSQYFDTEKFKAPKPDLSIFGEIQQEIMEFLNVPAKEEQCDNSAEDLSEEKVDDSNLVTEELWEVNTKEVETVSVLKKDLMVTEDIMKDIGDICKVESLGDVLRNDRDSYFFEDCRKNDVKDNLNLFKEECCEDETFSSVDGANCTTVIKNEPADISDDVELLNHPLSMMTFEENHVSDEENAGWENLENYKLRLPNVRLHDIKFTFLPEDHHLSIINRLRAESEQKIQNYLDDDVKIADAEVKTEPIPDDSINSCTNPFLKDADTPTDLEVDLTKLNPNNPFLNFLQEDDKSSSGSTTSTVYDFPVATEKAHSWASFNDMSAETISQLGKSLRGSSSSSDSVKIFDDRRSCSTQTSKQQAKPVPVVENTVQYGYYCAPPYGNPSWSANYQNNPYYSVRFANFQGYSFETQLPPRPPGLPPPPGFFPPNKFPVPRNFGPIPPNYSNMQYRPQGPTGYYPSPLPTGGVMPRFPPVFNQPNPTQSVSVSADAISGSVPVPSGSAGGVSGSRDFYDLYNEQLKQKIQPSNQ